MTATQYNGDKQDLVQNAAKHSIAVGQHVQALVRALLWAGKYVLGADVDPEAPVTVDFDDSYIVDKETQKEQFRQFVIAGKVPLWYYLTRFEDMEESEAKAIANESARALGDPYADA